MEYQEAADFLFGLRRFQVDPGTESVRALLDHVDVSPSEIRFVQIAGSNGKGSVARMTESILRAADHSVGLYTSPHFEDVRERIRVDGRKIPEAVFCEFLAVAKPFLTDRAAAGDPLTFFEVVTAMGLWQFDRADVDVAVLEVGMGGELDATSVVSPDAAAVTNVALEHTDVLGDTIEEIARKKASIAPDGTPLVTGATEEALDAVRAHADDVVTVGYETNSDSGTTDDEPDVCVRYEGRANHAESKIEVVGPDWRVDARLPLLGRYQAINAGIATTLARQVADSPPTAEATQSGLRSAHWPGRFEVLDQTPLYVLDGAHNPNACEKLATTLADFEYDDLHLVFGAMKDKDHRDMAEALPTPATATTCEPNLDRAEDADVLATVFRNAGAGAVASTSAVQDAVERALTAADPDDCVLVTGSLFCVAEARSMRTRLDVPRRVRNREDALDVLGRAHLADSTVRDVRDETIHRVFTTRLDLRQAEELVDAMGTAGGTCARADRQEPGDQIGVVLSGTHAEFDRLIDALADRPYGLSKVGADLQAALDREQAGRDPYHAPTETTYPWDDRTAVMGILNVTPDSFYDGGEYFDAADAVARAKAMVDAGADIVDVGGESTRPGAEPVPAEEEIERVVPVIEALENLDVWVSIDTRKAAVARAALSAGADVLNDVTGLDDPEMRFLAADREVPVVVMHSIDAPVDPEREVEYDDVVSDVIDDLRERVLLAEKAGIPRDRVLVDPGLGFGKDSIENFALLGRLDELRALGCPVLVGHSRKSMFDAVTTHQENDDRLAATIAGTAVAVTRGADVVRVHDVTENATAVRTVSAAMDPDVMGE